MLCAGSSLASAQTYEVSKPRKHFITFSYDWIYTEPLHFAEHPLSDLLGREVGAVQREAYEYRTRDEATLIDVIEFSRRQIGLGASIFPLGMSTGPTLMLRGNIVPLPRIQIEFHGPAPFPRYALLDGRAFDGAIGLMMADRSPGWGLGSHAFVAGASASSRPTSATAAASSQKVAAGSMSVRSASSSGSSSRGTSCRIRWSTRFLTIPITIRGTLTF